MQFQKKKKNNNKELILLYLKLVDQEESWIKNCCASNPIFHQLLIVLQRTQCHQPTPRWVVFRYDGSGAGGPGGDPAGWEKFFGFISDVIVVSFLWFLLFFCLWTEQLDNFIYWKRDLLILMMGFWLWCLTDWSISYLLLCRCISGSLGCLSCFE